MCEFAPAVFPGPDKTEPRSLIISRSSFLSRGVFSHGDELEYTVRTSQGTARSSPEHEKPVNALAKRLGKACPEMHFNGHEVKARVCHPQRC